MQHKNDNKPSMNEIYIVIKLKILYDFGKILNFAIKRMMRLLCFHNVNAPCKTTIYRHVTFVVVASQMKMRRIFDLPFSVFLQNSIKLSNFHQLTKNSDDFIACIGLHYAVKDATNSMKCCQCITHLLFDGYRVSR